MTNRDHGGGLDQAIVIYGGDRRDWIDLSTGINPDHYPIDDIPTHFWTALPDSGPQNELLNAARAFWNVPDGADIVVASGVSAIIAALPSLAQGNQVSIAKPTYNEHEAAFAHHGVSLAPSASTQVFVHPNNPDGRQFSRDEITQNHHSLTIIDESFCDTCPDHAHIDLADQDGFVILKGLGKFWGLAGLRLGFAITPPKTAQALLERLGPWSISGPAQLIGARALRDSDWVSNSRRTLLDKASHLDKIMTHSSVKSLGGTSLFRLYEVENAKALQDHLAQHQIWSRIFPYSDRWVRLGMAGSSQEWTRLELALRGFW